MAEVQFLRCIQQKKKGEGGRKEKENEKEKQHAMPSVNGD